MLYIVDGTGSDLTPLFRDHSKYDMQMQGGMCDRLRTKFNGIYYRGPSGAGYETYRTADTVYGEIKQDPGFNKQPLFLAGHSRGGAAVIRVAQLLKKDGRKVDGMFLFDAVDRTASKNEVQQIPRNVKFVAHALRNRSLATIFGNAAFFAREKYFKCRDATRGHGCEQERRVAENYTKLDDAMKTRSRAGYDLAAVTINFGNCGLEFEPACSAEEANCEFKREVFFGSHGAIGGRAIGVDDRESWISAEDQHLYRNIIVNDRMAISLVWNWMSEFFEKKKLALHGAVLTPMHEGKPKFTWPSLPPAPR